MRPQNTRFNPTCDGNLHLGHAYLALVNEYEAHRAGGKFIVRFDDDQEYWRWKIGPVETEAIKQGMMEDLYWLGIKADAWVSQDQDDDVDGFLDAVMGIKLNKTMGIREQFYPDEIPEIVGAAYTPYPYVPHITARKVAMDFLEGINLVIRGVDLIDEWALYTHFCHQWGIPAPRQVFLPRLTISGKELRKSDGNFFSVRENRETGTTAGMFRNLLAQTCLINPAGPWSIENVRPNL